LFQLLAGLLLPDAEAAARLGGRQDLWLQVQQEWLELTLSWSIGIGPGSFGAGLWVQCSNADAVPPSLTDDLQALVAAWPGVRLILSPAELGLDAEAAMALSQIVIAIHFADDGRLPPTAQDRLWQLRLQQSLPHQRSMALEVHRQRDQVLSRQRRPEHASADDPGRPRSPAKLLEQRRHTLAYWCRLEGDGTQPGWEEQLQSICNQVNPQGLSDRGWHTRILVTWALWRSGRWSRWHRRWLVGGATAVILLSWLTPALLPARPVLPMACLYGIAALLGWLLLRPLRLQAQQWWCLAQLFWVQDSWWCFHRDDLPSQRLTASAGMSSTALQGPLVQLLQAHQVDLLLRDRPMAWHRDDVNDVVKALELQTDKCKKLEFRTRRRRDLIQGLIVVAAFLLLLDVIGPSSLIIRQGLLTVLFLWAAIWLGSDGPMLPPQRLRRHRLQLSQYKSQLEDWSLGADPSNAVQRQMVSDVIESIGQEQLDLITDGLDHPSMLGAPRPWLNLTNADATMNGHG
jgi:hypothetical protein